MSFFKRLGVYLNVGLLGAASIRRRRLFQKSKQKKMKSCVTSEQQMIFLKPCGVKLLTKDVNYDLLRSGIRV